jgi:hypothetical protein
MASATFVTFEGRAVVKNANYHVKCLLCAAEVGQIVSGRFAPDPGGRAPAPHKGGMPRCGHCGGSVYLEPIDVSPTPVGQAEFADRIAAQAVRRPGLAE